jgi:hypothetical protein
MPGCWGQKILARTVAKVDGAQLSKLEWAGRGYLMILGEGGACKLEKACPVAPPRATRVRGTKGR